MKKMNLDVGNGSYSVGLCCWDADKGSRKEAVFICEGHIKYTYDSLEPKYFAMEWAKDEWAKDEWAKGSARTVLYRVAVSNGEETKYVMVTVSSKPEASFVYMPEQTLVDLDTMSKRSD